MRTILAPSVLVLLWVVSPSCGEDDLPGENAIEASVPPPGGFRGPADPAKCGDGRLDPGEVCDDGFHGACGDCNVDCSGPGQGSVCGDGFHCAETEACDDGGVLDCGPCNADCTAAGDGSACGDGTVCPDVEACDDGMIDECGNCNADCTGPGTGPSVCGNGDVCETPSAGVEVCDDGFEDACGSCNEDCTGDGTPVVCGDGDLCAELELCDDAVAGRCDDPCACPDSMFTPACGGVTSNGKFNAGEVYLFGELMISGAPDPRREAIVHWSSPSRPIVGVHPFDGDHVVRPSDGTLLYLRAEGNANGGVWEFACDGCPWNGSDYPEDILDNDGRLNHGPCNPVNYVQVNSILVSPDGLVLHECSGVTYEGIWYDQDGWDRYYGGLVHLGFEGAVLGYSSLGLYVDQVDGGAYSGVSGLPGLVFPLTARALPPASGSGPGEFWVVTETAFSDPCGCDVDATCTADCHCDLQCACPCNDTGGCTDACSCDPDCTNRAFELWRVDVTTGGAVHVLTYGERPSHNFQSVRIDATGSLYAVTTVDGFDAIVRLANDGSDFETLYTEEAAEAVTIPIGARLFTGP